MNIGKYVNKLCHCFHPSTTIKYRKFCNQQNMNLNVILQALEKLAPLRLAASWDNVGLLVQPSPPHIVKNVLLTIDLTESVMEESIQANADMIISYHPPIFASLKRLTEKHWKQRIVIKALENRIAIYSPHTACDAVQNGVNDWLAGGLGEVCTTKPINMSSSESPGKLVKLYIRDVVVASQFVQKMGALFSKVQTNETVKNGVEIQIACHDSDLPSVLNEWDSQQMNNLQILDLSSVPLLHTGMGRVCRLINATSIKDIIGKLKQHLAIPHVRVALGDGAALDNEIETVALCAGSGSSVLKGVKADVYLTGEMSHHDVLDAVANGVTVILCEHTNTERGFLHNFRALLQKELQSTSIQITVSTIDKDPLHVL